jgi:DNA-binding transcriptional LysR family regulator
MNLAHLAIFNAVAEEKSITRGAERLLISQPAVSKQIRLLEKHLGAVLLERQPRGVHLTAAGELLAGYARQIFALEAEAVRAIQELAGLRAGRLAVGASTTIGVYLLPRTFVEFRRRHPAIETRLDIASSATVCEHLMNGTVDVGFIESAPATPELPVEEFARDELVAIAPSGHPLLHRRRVTAKMLCAEPFVVRATGSDTKSFVERALAERGLSIKPAMSLGTTEAIKRAVAAGVGVAIVSQLSIALELKAKNLARVPVTGLRLSRPLYCVRRKNSPPSAALAAFLELLKSTRPWEMPH